METAHAAPPVATGGEVDEQLESTAPKEAAALHATPATMFRYSAYLHVGPGAEECEHREDGQCEERSHFHAWCRLPNKFQHRDLYEKATAAKARRLRLLHDDESDAREVLEADLETFKGDALMEVVIDDLLKGEVAADYVIAIREVGEREEFEHIDQDRERFLSLSDSELARADDEQSEEYRELARHVAAWREAVKTELEGLQAPKRELMRSLSRDQLIDQLRKQRMTQIADQLYLHVYNTWEWFVCTMKVDKHPATGQPATRYWAEMGTIDNPTPGSMWGESPEVIEALQATYDGLETALQAGISGNS